MFCDVFQANRSGVMCVTLMYYRLIQNALWVYGTLYKVKKATNFLLGEMWLANKLSGL